MTIFAGLPASEDAEHRLIIEGDDLEARLVFDGEMLLDGVRSWAIIDRIVWELNQVAWRSAPNHVLVHAATVEIDGHGVLICGPSGAGKTTLAAALCVAGAGYLSDEIAVLDPATGVVFPFAKPLSIRTPMWQSFSILSPPAWLGEHMRGVWYVPLQAASAVPITVVVTPSYEGGDAGRAVKRNRAETLIDLCGQTPQLARYGADGFDALSALIADSVCVAIDTSDLAIACRTIFDLVADAKHEKKMGAERLGANMVAAASVRTALIDAESVLFDVATAQLHHLNVSGTRIWTMINDGRTEAEVIAALSESATEPEAQPEVSAFIGSLRAGGLIRKWA